MHRIPRRAADKIRKICFLNINLSACDNHSILPNQEKLLYHRGRWFCIRNTKRRPAEKDRCNLRNKQLP